MCVIAAERTLPAMLRGAGRVGLACMIVFGAKTSPRLDANAASSSLVPGLVCGTPARHCPLLLRGGSGIEGLGNGVAEHSPDMGRDIELPTHLQTTRQEGDDSRDTLQDRKKYAHKAAALMTALQSTLQEGMQRGDSDDELLKQVEMQV